MLCRAARVGLEGKKPETGFCQADASQAECAVENGGKAVSCSLPSGLELLAWTVFYSGGEEGRGSFQAGVARRRILPLHIHQVLTLCHVLFEAFLCCLYVIAFTLFNPHNNPVGSV